MCLLMIDIDHFKNINDRHGHTLGDDVIRAVGQTLLDCVRAQDCAGRYGGDEFAVVCRNTHAAFSGESMSPLAITGMRARDLIAAIVSYSALPV